jgi:peptidase M28-like protein
MRHRVWLFSTVGVIALLGGVLVYRNSLGAKPPPVDARPFDGERAIAYLTAVCDIGPRISGSDGMAKQREMLQKHFEKHGAAVTLQKFDGKQPSQDKSVPMANMIVSWQPKAERRVMICGHYDTRPIADQETNVRDWTKPFASANDGTATVAFMMELAHHMKELKTEVGVDFVLFDAEEFIHDRNRDKFFLGSEHFAAEYKKAKDGPKYAAGILLDLFAGKDATYRVEHNSALLAGPLVEDVWKLAADLGISQFENAWGHEVLDDHIALNKAGIPCIDIIDFDYKHWHKLSDTPDKCSAESMATVAKVIMVWLQKVK